MGSPLGQHPIDQAVTRIEKQEEKQREEGDSFGNMAENVVADLVSCNEQDLRVGGLGDGRVQHDDALGGAEARDIGINGGCLLASAHPEHALTRDILACSLHQLLKAGSEYRILLSERL